MRMHDTVIAELAARQHGIVSRPQLRTAGVDHRAITRRLDSGALERVAPRVFRVRGAPATTESQLMAALLDVADDACISFESAAAFWGMPGFRLLPPMVTGIRSTSRSHALVAAELHRPCQLTEDHIVEIDGLRVTTPTRMLFDLAGRLSAGRMARLMDRAWSDGLVSHASIMTMLDQLAGRGRPGIALMRELMAERPPEHRPPESNAEARFEELARRNGFHDFERQVDVGGDAGWIGRVDFLDRSRRLIVELDSQRWHSSLTDRRRDRDRHAALQAENWTVLSITDFDVFHRTDEVDAVLRPHRWTHVP